MFCLLLYYYTPGFLFTTFTPGLFSFEVTPAAIQKLKARHEPKCAATQIDIARHEPKRAATQIDIDDDDDQVIVIDD